MLESEPNRIHRDKVFKKERFSNIIFKVEVSVEKQFLRADGQQAVDRV